MVGVTKKPDPSPCLVPDTINGASGLKFGENVWICTTVSEYIWLCSLSWVDSCSCSFTAESWVPFVVGAGEGEGGDGDGDGDMSMGGDGDMSMGGDGDGGSVVIGMGGDGGAVIGMGGDGDMSMGGDGGSVVMIMGGGGGADICILIDSSLFILS